MSAVVINTTSPPFTACSARCDLGVMVPVYGASLMDAVLASLRESADHIALESFAAERIQATYRMFKARKAFVRQRKAVCDMQRVYRGARARAATRALRETEAQRRDVFLFHYYATRIQAIFRGYSSRKHRCDFYARKAYVDAVTKESEMVRTLVNDFHEEQAAMEALQQRMQESNEYAQATAKVHHLLSTAAVSGVYRRPLALTGTATSFGTNVEEDVRRHAAHARRPVIEAERRKNASVPIRPTGTSTRRAVASTPPPCASLAVETEATAHHTNGVGLAATLPPIRRSRPAQATAAAMTTRDAPSCAWENPDARPPTKPLVDPASQTARSRTKAHSGSATSGKAPRRPAGTSPGCAKAVSSFNRQFAAASHDCGAGAEGGVPSRATTTNLGPSDATSLQPTYDTASAVLQKSVDAKLVKSLHGGAVFKVPAPR